MIVTVLQLIAVFGVPVLILRQREKGLVRTFGTIAMAYFWGIVVAVAAFLCRKAGLDVRLNADVGQIGSYVCIGLAIPLLMFGTNLADVRRLAKPVLISFALLLLAVSAVVVVLGRTLGAGFPWGQQLAAMAAGMYTGGSPNFNAIGVILGVPGDTIAIGNLSDMIVGTVFYIFILTLAKPLCAKVLDRHAKQGAYMRENGGAENVDALEWNGFHRGIVRNLALSLACVLVGAVIGFIPQMVILFLLLGILELCGYMSRVAFIMDRIFRKFGLSGKSFIPMLIASGCGVPAVMSTKTIENEMDRRMTIMTTTMIPCGAKMPIIALVFGALASGDSSATWYVAPMFYFLGVIAIILSGIMLKKTKLFAGEATPFVMELPEYHMPTVKSILLSMWERVKGYIIKAGTIIFLSTIVIWFLMNFGDAGEGFGLLDPDAPDYMEHSLMAGLGNLLAWIFAPLGFDNWQATATAVTGLVAKENVVATVGIITQLADYGEADPQLWFGFLQMLGGSTAAVVAFCAFNLLCAPCFAAMGTIRQQQNSPKWFWITIGYLCGFAWCVGTMLYQFVGLATGEVEFNVFTVVAIVIAAVMLFQIFRPMPKRGEKQEK